MPNVVDPRVFQLPVYMEARANRLRNLFYYVDPHSLRGKRVLEAGCGTGELGEEFVKLGCRVVSIDATAEYIQELKTKYPAREACVVDLDAFDPTPLGAFDIILCFGLLYHLWKPTRFLSVCASIAEEIYLDTMMCDSEEITYYLMREQGADQAFSSVGCRPTDAWVRLVMNQLGFEVRDISSALANWEADSPAVFDWVPQNDQSLKRGAAYLRRMYICSRTACPQPATS